jgi:hypothetical protein
MLPVYAMRINSSSTSSSTSNGRSNRGEPIDEIWSATHTERETERCSIRRSGGSVTDTSKIFDTTLIFLMCDYCNYDNGVIEILSAPASLGVRGYCTVI